MQTLATCLIIIPSHFPCNSIYGIIVIGNIIIDMIPLIKKVTKLMIT